MTPDPLPFWQRPRIRQMVPLAIGLAALAMLLLTLVIAPRRGIQFVPPPPPARAPEKGVITEAHVAFREGPSASSGTITELDRGASIMVEDQQGIWCRATDASARTGFLLRQAVERESERAARIRRGETILKFAPLSGEVINPAWMLLGPYSFAPVYAQASRGAAVDIYAVDHAYYAVKLPDGTLGFLSAGDVDLVPLNPSEPALKRPPGKVVTGITVAEESSNSAATPLPTSSTPAAPPESPPEAAAIPAPGMSAEPGELVPAILIEKVEPVYPAAALGARVSGTVVLEISVDVEGLVTKVDVKREAPLGMTQAAVEAVSRWRYRPARTASGPISSMKLVRINFQPPG